MKHNRQVTTIAALLLVVLFAGSVLALDRAQRIRGSEATLEDVLYISSAKTLKRMSLGYSGLLADIYWTRAVQYFGSRVQRARHFELVAPLLEITTDLDPHLIPPYETGSIFLTQRIPYGSGQPDKAVALLEKGIRENPGFWRLYFNLGFVNYLEKHDYKAAQEAFAKGSQVPGAPPALGPMAARMAEHSKDVGTAIALWQTVYDTNREKTIREGARKHIASLQADAVMEELERRVQTYRAQHGALPTHWSDLLHAGLLQGIPADEKGIPIDPSNAAFKLMPDGTVQVEDPKQFPFLGEGRAENK